MQPEDSELIEYAEFMGVNLAREGYLLEILQQGLNAPLPAGWDYKDRGVEVEFISPTGYVLHEHPIDKTIRKKIADARPYNVTSLITMRKPSDEEIESVLKYFGVDSENPQAREKCAAFMTTIPKGWEIYEFSGSIFFVKGEESTFQHPLEQEFRSSLQNLSQVSSKNVAELKEQYKVDNEQMTPQKTSRDAVNRMKCADGVAEEFKEVFAAGATKCYIVVPETVSDYIRLIPEPSAKHLEEIHGKQALEFSKDDILRLRAIQEQFDARLTEMKNHHAELVYEETSVYYRQIEEIRDYYQEELKSLRLQNARELEYLTVDRFTSLAVMRNYAPEHREEESAEELRAYLKQCNAELAQYQNQSLQLYSTLDQLYRAYAQLREQNTEIAKLSAELRRGKALSRVCDCDNLKSAPFVKDLREMIDGFNQELQCVRGDIRAYICSYQARAQRDGAGSRYIDFQIAEFYRKRSEVYRANALYCVLELGLDDACCRLGIPVVEDAVRQAFCGLRKDRQGAFNDWKAEFKERLG